MDRINTLALALCLLLATPALADDVWDLPDAVSKTVTERSETEEAAGEEPKAEREPARDEQDKADSTPLRDRGREEEEQPVDGETRSSGWSGVGVVEKDEEGAASSGGATITVRDHSADAEPGQPRATGPQRDTRTSNVLGPLWGLPQDAPVMKNIDPELEAQYARDGEGRLVPRSELSKEDAERVRQEEREQQRAEREAQFERDRQERAAKAEQKRLEREAAREQQRQDRETRDADKARQADEQTAADETTDEAEDEAEQAPAADGEGRAEHYDHKVGGRSTPESEGW